MDREKIILYSEKTENLGEPETFLGRGEAREPGCGDVLAMFVDTRREIITECRFTITESACPPLKACAARAAQAFKGGQADSVIVKRHSVMISRLVSTNMASTSPQPGSLASPLPRNVSGSPRFSVFSLYKIIFSRSIVISLFYSRIGRQTMTKHAGRLCTDW